MSTLDQIMQWESLAIEFSKGYPILSPQEILASIYTESSGNPSASNPGDPSWGLMGIEWLIARVYGHFSPPDDSWQTDPQKNMSCGVPYLAYLKAKYQDINPPHGWVGAYNAGETNFREGFLDQSYVTGWSNHLAQIEEDLSGGSAVDEGELDG